jgi:hypothetical protein
VNPVLYGKLTWGGKEGSLTKGAREYLSSFLRLDNYSSINEKSNTITGRDKIHCTVPYCIRTGDRGLKHGMSVRSISILQPRSECLTSFTVSTIMISVSVYLTMPLIFITWVHHVEWIIANNRIEKQDRQCAYNVKIRCFRTTVAVERQ